MKHSKPSRSTRRARQPRLPIARRLELTRAAKGFASLRAFWEKLSDGWLDEDGKPVHVSYEAVGWWHHDREPPISYLVRVSNVFDVRLEWLASGVGSQLEPKVVRPSGALQNFDYYADTLGLTEATREVLIDVSQALRATRTPLGSVVCFDPWEGIKLLEFIEAASEWPGFRRATPPAEFNTFTLAMLVAFRMMIGAQGSAISESDTDLFA